MKLPLKVKQPKPRPNVLVNGNGHPLQTCPDCQGKGKHTMHMQCQQTKKLMGSAIVTCETCLGAGTTIYQEKAA